MCRYTNLQRPADATIADYWGIEKAHPEFMDKKGVSLVLINTLKGKELFESIKNSIIYIESDTERCMQRNLKTPTPCPEGRDLAWEHYKKYGFEGIAKKYGGYNLKSVFKERIKSMISRAKMRYWGFVHD